MELKQNHSHNNCLLDVKNLKVQYGSGKNTFTAVDGISFRVKKHRTLGLVGESGCGKTSTGLAIIRLIPVASGRIRYRGKDLLSLPAYKFLPFRKRIQIIFQNPDSSLNPRLTIRTSLQEALSLGHPKEKDRWDEYLREKLELVGLSSEYQMRYPHELSGGQLQRIGIARALCVEPELIICDEPVSSLDVSIQAQILNLLVDLQKNLGLSYIFISHDLSVIRHISHELAVMHKGTIKEIGTVEDIFSNPKSKYTKSLLAALPGQNQAQVVG
jgi:ABC-type oligopeptide transport system ATPase subunit